MQSQVAIDEHQVFIEYCKSCDSHNWCTHHNQQKYKQAYIDLSKELQQQFPHIRICGNEPPHNLVPIKAKQNKYFDSKNKKYVLFPAIGAFEVSLNHQLIFSKRNTNAWPNNNQIINAIYHKIKGQKRKRIMENQQNITQKQIQSEKLQKQTVAVANNILRNFDQNSFSETKTHKKQFTLTDHFKRYKMKKKIDDDLTSLYAESQSAKHGRISKITAEDIKKLHHIWGKKQNLPNFIKNKAFIQEREGRKQMLVNLSSIQQQSQLKQNYAKTRINRKNKSPTNLQLEFQKLQNKFLKFQNRVSQVNNKNFELEGELRIPPTNKKQCIKKQKKTQVSRFNLANKIQEVKTAYNAQKLLKEIKDRKKIKIQQYIHATSQQKNQKLQQIYGPQLLKQNVSNQKSKRQKKSNKKKNSEYLNQKSQNQGQYQQQQQKTSQQDSNADIFVLPQRTDANSFHSAGVQNQFNFTQSHFKKEQNKRNIYTRQKLSSSPKDFSAKNYQKLFLKQKRAYQSRSVLHKAFNSRPKIKIQKQSIENNKSSQSDQQIIKPNSIIKKQSATSNEKQIQNSYNRRKEKVFLSSKMTDKFDNSKQQKKQFKKTSKRVVRKTIQNQLEEYNKGDFINSPSVFNSNQNSQSDKSSKIQRQHKKNSMHKNKDKKRNNESQDKGESFEKQNEKGISPQFTDQNTQKLKQQKLNKKQKKIKVNNHSNDIQQSVQNNLKQEDQKLKNTKKHYSNDSQVTIRKQNKQKRKNKQKIEKTDKNDKIGKDNVMFNKKKYTKNFQGKIKNKDALNKRQKENKQNSAIRSNQSETEQIQSDQCKQSDSQISQRSKEQELFKIRNEKQEQMQQNSKQNKIQSNRCKKKQVNGKYKKNLQKSEESSQKKEFNKCQSQERKKQKDEEEQVEEEQVEGQMQRSLTNSQDNEEQLNMLGKSIQSNEQQIIIKISKPLESIDSSQNEQQEKLNHGQLDHPQTAIKVEEEMPTHQPIKNKQPQQQYQQSQRLQEQQIKQDSTTKNNYGRKERRSPQNCQVQVQQVNNVQTQSKPRRIYEIDQQRPQMIDAGVQKNAPKEAKQVQTVQEEIQPLSKLKKIKSKANTEEKEQKCEESNKVQENSQNMIKAESADKINKKISKNLQSKTQQRQTTGKNSTAVKIDNKDEQLSKSNYIKIQNNKKEQKIQKHTLAAQKIHNQYRHAAITKQLYGQEYQDKVKQAKFQISLYSESKKKEKNTPLPMRVLYDSRKSRLFDHNQLEFDKIVDKSEKLGNLCKVINVLCRKNEYLIIRLFDNPQIQNAQCYGIWLCHSYKWNFIKVKAQIQLDSKNQPLHLHHQTYQIWPVVLVQALTKLLGTFQKLTQASVPQLFHILTGSNYLNFKVKEDLSKNDKLLSFIAVNQKKNFIVLAQKRIHNSLAQSLQYKKENSVFYILSQKIINNKQVLLRMKKDNQDAFWIKLQKFVSEFSEVQVLQLRVNHNFTQLALEQNASGTFRVIQLIFQQQCFGCVAFLSQSKQTDFKIYLYKEQQDNILRLVGQAKQKNKRFTFFDCCFDEGKYLAFADIKSLQSTMFYTGQGQPQLRMKQQIKQAGLKNNYTEYIPIKNLPQKKQQEMPKFLSMTKKTEREGIFGIESAISSEHQSKIDKGKLRNQFIDYLIKN